MGALTLRERAQVRADLVSRMLSAHGGGVEVDSCDDGSHLRLRFNGLCTACPMRPMTLARIVTPAFSDLDGVTVEIAGVRLSGRAQERLDRSARE